MVRAGSNLLAESSHRRPAGEEDRSGPGNNKSIYESETGGEGDRERRSVLFHCHPTGRSQRGDRCEGGAALSGGKGQNISCNMQVIEFFFCYFFRRGAGGGHAVEF